MKKVLAALDNSVASRPVMAGARALAAILGAEVEAVHVTLNGSRTARSVAKAAKVPFSTLSGAVVSSLVAAGARDEVVAVAVGARGTPSHLRPLGTTAAAIATNVAKPVLVVPPDSGTAAYRRVLVPIEGARSAALAPHAPIDLVEDVRIEAVALHVYDEMTMPAFTERPEHEHTAWADEFLRRYCPSGLETVALETRVGRTAEVVADVAAETECDLIALGWSQDLAGDRAAVVRGTLERSRVPVLLVPVRAGGEAAPRSGNPRTADHPVPGWRSGARAEDSRHVR